MTVSPHHVCSARAGPSGVVRRRGRGPRHAADHAHQRGGGPGCCRSGQPRPFGQRARARRPRGRVRRHEGHRGLRRDRARRRGRRRPGRRRAGHLRRSGRRCRPEEGGPERRTDTDRDRPDDDGHAAAAHVRLHRRPDQRLERQHDPSRGRHRLPGDRRGVEHRPHVELAWCRSTRGVRRRVDIGARHAPRRVGRSRRRPVRRRQHRRLRAGRRRVDRGRGAAAAPVAPPGRLGAADRCRAPVPVRRRRCAHRLARRRRRGHHRPRRCRSHRRPARAGHRAIARDRVARRWLGRAARERRRAHRRVPA